MKVSRAKQKKLSAEGLRSLLNYDRCTGSFCWLPRAGRNWFNSTFAGKLAGALHTTGYLLIEINGSAYYAHRLAWLYVHGEWPENDIDHHDGDRLNNKLLNLRPCLRVENMQNYKKPKTNTSGFVGVSKRSPTSERWRAHITVSGTKISLGTFATREEARDAYLSAKITHHTFQPIPRQEAA